jgi:hypothetical protein
VKILAGLGIVCVEDLAQANEELAGRIGMGARSLIQRAKDFITAKSDLTPLVARLDAIQRELDRAQHQIREQDAEIQRLRSSSAQQVQPAAPILQHNNLPSLDQRLDEARAEATKGDPTDAQLVEEALDSELDA